MKKYKPKNINEIIKKVAEENGVEFKEYKNIYSQIMTRVVTENMNGNPVEIYPLGKYKIQSYRAREIKGFQGEITLLPQREKLKFQVSELYERLYKHNGYYDRVEDDGDNPFKWTVVINKNTFKIKNEGLRITDCILKLSELSWKGNYLFEIENKEEFNEINNFLLSYLTLSEQHLEEIKEKIKSCKDKQEKIKLNKYLNVCNTIMINFKKERYNFEYL